MFALTPLTVALQGIGYATLLTALQGLVAVTIAPEPVLIDATGSQAAFNVKRHVRRFRGVTALLPPATPSAPLVDEQDEEEALSLLGLI